MTLETISDLRQIPGTIQNEHCNILGYYTPGDSGGGEFYWDQASVEPDNNGTVIKVAGFAGSWNRIYYSAINPKWFGAKGDGSSDDTTALSYCLNNFGEVNLEQGNYKVSDMSLVMDTLVKNGTISLFPFSRISLYAHLILEYVVFDALDQTVRTAILYAFSGSITGNHCCFRNIKTETPPAVPITATGNQYGIIADMAGCDVMLDDVSFESISAMGDPSGAEEQNGFCGGIFLLGSKEITYDNPSSPTYYKTVYSHPSRICIRNCVFRNIYTMRHPSNTGPLDTDADAIRLTINGYEDRFDVVHDVLLEGNRFIDIQKSCVKASNFNGMIISNTVIQTEEMITLPLVGAFRFQPVKDVVVSNVLYKGACTFLMYARNCKHISYQQIQIMEGSDVTTGFEVVGDNQSISISDSSIFCGRFFNIQPVAPDTGCKTFQVFNCRAIQQMPQNPFARISNASDVLISNSDLITIDAANIDCIHLIDAPRFRLSNANLFYGRTAIACVENNLTIPNNISIDSSSFRREQISTGSRHLLLRATTGSNQQLTGVQIRDCDFTAYSQPSKTNDEILLISCTDVVLANLQLKITQLGANMAQPAGGLIQILQCSKVSIFNVQSIHDFIPIGESFAVLIKESSKISVAGIRSFEADGLTLYVDVDNISADSIYSKLGRNPLQEIAVPPNKYYSNVVAVL